MKINNHVKSPKKYNVEDLLSFLANELKISENVELTITYNEDLLNKLSTNVEYEAFLHNIIPHKYVLYVREGLISQYVLCHEMIHLCQYESGRLKMSPDFKTIIWEDKQYDNSLNYNEREWEKEAFKNQSKLWKLFKKSNKKCNTLQ